jgi:hypothetical protein
MLVEGRDVGLIAGDTIQRFRQQKIELPCPSIFEQLLNARA